MKLLIYLLINLLGFSNLPTSVLNAQISTVIDEQTAIVNSLLAVSEPQLKNEAVTLDTQNPYWLKITLHGNTEGTYKIKQGNSMLVMELPKNYIDPKSVENLPPICFETLKNMEFKQINDCLYLFIEFAPNFAVRTYTDLNDPKVIHIDIARKEQPYRATAVVDAGHGGSDPGAVNGNLYEKDVVLDIAKRMENILKDSGIDVVFTRRGDEDVKVEMRPVIANQANPDVFVSLHNNSSESSKPHGICTYTFIPSAEQAGKRLLLAEKVQQNLVQAFPDWKDLGILFDNFCVLRETKAPSILVEFGFISNPHDSAMLADPDIRQKAAEAIARGIIQYVDQTKQN